MRRGWTRRAGRWLAALLLAVMSALLLAPAQTAAQAPHAGGDTVSLSLENGTSFTYGGTTVPTFTAVVTFGAKPTASYGWMIYVRLDNGAPEGSATRPTTSDDGMTLTFAHLKPSTTLAVGQHSATARFYNPGTGTTTESDPASFTITKATPNMSCSIDNAPTHLVGAGQTLHVHVSPSWPVPVDWQNATYTVTFDGPTHLSYSNLVPDNTAQVTVTGPTQVGKYVLGCAFSGTASFNPATFRLSDQPYLFSALHKLGTVQLFTNPTKLVANQKLNFYVVFHPAAGLPAPTGEVTFYIGASYYTSSFRLSSRGDLLLQVGPLPSMQNVNQITVRYWGDMYYGEASINFPTTNPPIPTGAGTGGAGSGESGSGNNPQATITAEGTPGTQATPSAGATTAVDDIGDVLSSGPAAAENSGGLLWIGIGALALLLLAGGGVAGVLMHRARRRVPPDDGDYPPTIAAPLRPGPPYFDTIPEPRSRR